MRYAVMVLAAGWLTAAAWGGQIELAEPMRMRFAGATLALPKGYEIISGGDDSVVVQAARRENDKDVMLVTLTAWPVGLAVDLPSFVESRNMDFSRALAVREFKVVKTTSMKVAALDALVQVQTYDNRGVGITALRTFLLRPMGGEKGKLAMGYILAIEADAAHRGDALPTLREMLKSIELFDPVSPAAEKVEALGPPIESKLWGYSFRPPALWKARTERAGSSVTFLQADYTAGVRPAAMPQGHFQVVPGRVDAEASTADALRKLQETLAEQGKIYTVLEDGQPKRVGRARKAKMAGQDAYGFVVKAVTNQGAKGPRTMIFTQRTLVANGLRYSLALIYQAEDSAIAEDTMEKIAAGMEVFKPEALKPATAPAATAPATTAPAEREVIIPQ
ncbi:MAG TPA: hypothetical protein VFJ30_05985 [Phycisphaerae bacterium]|nr:hypothetical protein [Phycisphaerae bacterium]